MKIRGGFSVHSEKVLERLIWDRTISRLRTLAGPSKGDAVARVQGCECQLSPAADIALALASAALCQSTKSLRDSLLPDGLRIIPSRQRCGMPTRHGPKNFRNPPVI